MKLYKLPDTLKNHPRINDLGVIIKGGRPRGHVEFKAQIVDDRKVIYETDWHILHGYARVIRKHYVNELDALKSK